jgi:hypothetical protein
MCFPKLSEMASHDMLTMNPLHKLQKYRTGQLPRVKTNNVQECAQCHYYTENRLSPVCQNCNLKF